MFWDEILGLNFHQSPQYYDRSILLHMCKKDLVPEQQNIWKQKGQRGKTRIKKVSQKLKEATSALLQSGIAFKYSKFSMSPSSFYLLRLQQQQKAPSRFFFSWIFPFCFIWLEHKFSLFMGICKHNIFFFSAIDLLRTLLHKGQACAPFAWFSRSNWESGTRAGNWLSQTLQQNSAK